MTVSTAVRACPDTGSATPGTPELELLRSMGREGPHPVAMIDHVAHWAALDGEAPALLSCDAPPNSFAQLHAYLDGMARALQAVGIGREDRVGLLMPSGTPGARLALAVASHSTLVPLDPALTPGELAEYTRATALAALVFLAPGQAAPALAEFGEDLLLIRAEHGPGADVPTLARIAGRAREAVVRPARDDDVAVILKSSGTTGAPKLIPSTWSNLRAIAAHFTSERWFALTRRDRSALTLPLHYAAGLNSALFTPLLLGASVCIPPPGRGLDLASWVDLLRPTYLSCSPGTLEHIVDRLRTSGQPFEPGTLRFFMCTSSYLPEALRAEAEARLQLPVLEFYGLSEAGVMACNPLPPGKRKQGTVGFPLGKELRIADAGGRALPAGDVGRVLLQGPTVMPGYLSPETGRPQPLPDGWLDTGDLGCLDSDGYLTIVGRTKEVINRGGEKVFPYDVERALLQHPDVVEAAVFGVPHPRLGENVAAAVVTRPGSKTGAHEFRHFLSHRLARYKLPARTEVVPALPRGPTGKVLRRVLAEAHVHRARRIAPPAELLEFELLAIWQRVLRRESVSVDEEFSECGGDSLMATEMLLEVEALTGMPYPDAELHDLTIRHIAQVVIAGCRGRHEVLTVAKKGSGVPLFFCHGDYGSRGLYAHRLAALLPQNQPVYLLQCGDGAVERLSLEDIAAMYAAEVVGAAQGSPVVIGGYCNGGLAAWALAHVLECRGVRVQQLVLVETPSFNATPAMRWLARGMRAAASVLPRVERLPAGRGVMGTAWCVVRKATAESARELMGRLTGSRERPPPRVPLPGLERTEQLWLRRMASYVPPRLHTPVTCVIADGGTHFDTVPDRWRRLSPLVRAVATPGTHHTMVISERAALASTLTQALAAGLLAKA